MSDFKVVYCSQCGELLFVQTDNKFMVGNIITNEINAICGCGQRFITTSEGEIIEWKIE